MPHHGPFVFAFPILLRISSPIFFAFVIGYMSRKDKGRAARKEAQMAMARAAAYSLPAVSSAFKSNSIISMAWTMDYKTNIQLNRKMLLSSPLMYIVCILVGIAFDVLIVPIGFTAPPLVLAMIFILGNVLFVASLYYWTGRVLRETYYFSSETLSTGMIVDLDAIRLIYGANEYRFPWAVINNIIVIQGNVAFIRADASCLVPSFAFKSTGDAEAFAATLRTLKKGLTPPVHDWSAYVPQIQTNEGVWPPPPAP